MHCCRPRTKVRGSGTTAVSLSEDAAVNTQGRRKNTISPWSHYPPIESQSRHRISRNSDGWDAETLPSFDARRVNEACRGVSAASLTPAMRSDTTGVLIPVKKQKDQIVKLPDTVKREIVALSGEQQPQWWKAQFSDNRLVQKAEEEERQRRREISKVVFAVEKERQMSEIVVNQIEEMEDRARRREFAKHTLTEEQHTRVREQQEAELHDDMVRERRRQWALKALRTEEVRRTTDRLMLREVAQGRAEKRGENLRLWREKEEQRQEAARNRALLVYGVKLEVRCLKKEDEDNGVETSMEERGPVSRAILELHAILCTDDAASQAPRTSGRLSVAEVEAKLREDSRHRLLTQRHLCPSCSATQAKDVSAEVKDHEKSPVSLAIPNPDVSQLYSRPPHCPKARWTEVGDHVAAREKRPCPETDNVFITGERWISLRLDGSGFSRFTQLMRHQGVFPRGYSAEFADIMVGCARDLLEKLNAYCVYTQSDEITVLIPARRLDEKTGVHFPHDVNGRVQKLASQSAAFVASRFNWRLLHLFAKKGLMGSLEEGGDLIPSSCLATFDCRVASYASFEEACAVLLWRAYDCGVNGISDKVHHLKGDHSVLSTDALHAERAEVSGKDTGAKLQWLAGLGLLPLPPHQAYGTFLCVVRRVERCTNYKTGEEALKLRRRVEAVHGNVIVNYLDQRLFPPDEELPGTETESAE